MAVEESRPNCLLDAAHLFIPPPGPRFKYTINWPYTPLWLWAFIIL